MAKEHFVTDKDCNTNKVLSFYDNTIYYDNKEINISALQKLKEDACSRFSGGAAASLNMKNNYIRVKDFEGNSNLKILVYDVEFEFYSEKKQQTVSGTTRVALIATVDTQKIVGELHKKL